MSNLSQEFECVPFFLQRVVCRIGTAVKMNFFNFEFDALAFRRGLN